MIEDEELNAFLKKALESDCAFSRRSCRNRHRAWLWTVPTLLAASLTFFIVLPAFYVQPTSEVVETIGFLSVVDGFDLSIEEGRAPEELLFAWQDAPCAVDFEE